MKKGIEIKDPEKISRILKVFSFLDYLRWYEVPNYSTINYHRTNLTADEKLLTHWLCYITDRQTRFERIWDVGGYVISHLVRSFTEKRDNDVWEDVMLKYVKIEPLVSKSGKISDHMRLQAPFKFPNKRLTRYEDALKETATGDLRVVFSSRFIPDDILLIFRTLSILDKDYDRSLAKFIRTVTENYLGLEVAIKHMTHALFQLTYMACSNLSVVDFHTKLNEVKLEVARFVLNPDDNRSLGGQKRLWCSVRDYLKSPEFNKIFVESLKDNRWQKTSSNLQSALRAIELPGDVWNSRLCDGILKAYIVYSGAGDIQQIARELYNKLPQSESDSEPTYFYPEKLDVSFDFIPLMCERSMCDVCPFGGGVKVACHGKEGILCSVALYSCGFKYKCKPSSCFLKEDSAKGYCKESSLVG